MFSHVRIGEHYLTVRFRSLRYRATPRAVPFSPVNSRTCKKRKKHSFSQHNRVN